MKKLFSNPMVQFTAVVVILFILATLILQPIELKRYMDAGRVGVYAVLLGVMAETAWSAYWSGAKQGRERVALALGFLAFVILFQAIWVPLKREVALPSWLAEGHTGSAIVLGFIIAGIGFLVPIGNTAGVTPPRNYWFIAVAGVIAGLVAGLMIGLGIKGSVI